MKKLILFISCLIMSMGLIACSNTEDPNTQEVTIIRQDCFEFDLETLQFTDNILLSINLTNEFEVNTDLVYNDPTYYIGDFKKRNESGEVVRTIQIYEYTNPNFNISTDSTKVSNNWSIANEDLENESAYSRTFYCIKDEYVIAMDIVNNTKEVLTVDDGLALLNFLTGEETKKPTKTEEAKITADATLDSPARLGEWISTTVYNKTSKSYEPICICIDEVYVGEIAQQMITDYNNISSQKDENFIPYYLSNAGAFDYVTIEYSIFFPSNFTMNSNGIADIKVPLTICNLRDNGKGIDGYLNLDQTFVDISEPISNIEPGTIWYDGVCLFEMSKDFDAYYIKIDSEDNLSETKYVRP